MVGLYRDDGLMLVKGSKGRSADKARKELHRIFDQFGLKITADVCHQSVNFLDVTLNLKENNFTPYRKPNNDPIYIDSRCIPNKMVGHEASSSRLPRNESLFSVHRGKKNDYVIRQKQCIEHKI